MRTQKPEVATRHLSNSRTIFLRLLGISRSPDDAKVNAMTDERDYEELDLHIVSSLLGSP